MARNAMGCSYPDAACLLSPFVDREVAVPASWPSGRARLPAYNLAQQGKGIAAF